MKTIKSVQLHAMCQSVLSLVTIKYYDEGGYSVSEEYGTIKQLCMKYNILMGENDFFEVRYLIGRKCNTYIKNGTTVFIHYY